MNLVVLDVSTALVKSEVKFSVASSMSWVVEIGGLPGVMSARWSWNLLQDLILHLSFVFCRVVRTGRFWFLFILHKSEVIFLDSLAPRLSRIVESSSGGT
ncbi:hypothetical protein NPIL_559031 [Nephila pilipes]|uniref:Uncharacterized protein n=1 Tax=Nephila pilipes TaxID=299642 RepID=A0A8X6NB67_NEPPI|nr:hypothetical protein NPIL_559031 [Nephila pilipes]